MNKTYYQELETILEYKITQAATYYESSFHEITIIR